jgi:hypothetical protein
MVDKNKKPPVKGAKGGKQIKGTATPTKLG